MTNKQWVLSTALRHQPGRVPFNFAYSPVALELIEKHYGSQCIEETFDFPIRMSAPTSIKPLYCDPGRFGPYATDEFGVTWTTSGIDRGSPVRCPLSSDSLDGYSFPDPSAPYRFEALPDFCSKNSGNFTVIWVGDLWERATFMRGMENILVDVSLNPAFVEELLDRLAAYILQTLEILFSRFSFDCIAVSDDYGTQEALVMSPGAWRRLVKPRLKEIYARAKKHGRYVFHHSCGNVEEIIPDLVEIGLDILHPVQPEAMDRRRLKSEYGADLCLCGGLGTQELMPSGTPAQVREEVRTLKERMGSDGGYILEPGITLQADVPVANLVAALEEAVR
jgi:uroporphyrinogen decarboxylase